MSNQLSEQLFKKLEEASNKWADWQKKVIILDEGRKAVFSACVIKHKKSVKTMSEAEHEARIDKDYKMIVEQYAESEKELIKARYLYANIDRYVSLKQSELKRDLALNSKI
jgi:Leu/Phe-tRNA-protein transferase